ncbi:MAG TPA: hypothetical protein VGZ47_04015 [Gemmataceae bacterium]|jgi:hypothetical protein|nr:hypothetical protein [Gemmataceae bacterium]
MFVPFLAAVLAAAQCPGGSCPAPVRIEWRFREDETQRAYLFLDGRQAGGYDVERDEWRGFDPERNAWSEAQALFPRRLVGAAADAVPNFGIMQAKLNGTIAHHSINGRSVSEADALAALQGKLTDDSQKLRLTIIGPENQRHAVLADLESSPSLAPLKDKVLVQSYDPKHWAVVNTGFRTTGQPTIYLQSADGKVLHRQDEYRGPEKLAEAIRKADPNYQPDKDPDLNKTNPPSVSPSFDLSHVPGWCCGACAAGIAFLIFRRRIRS